MKHDSETVQDVSTQTIYCLGRVEQFIRDYAESHGLPSNELTIQVATLLSASQSGSLLGIDDSVSPLRRRRSSRDKASRSMAMARRSYRKTQVTPRRGDKPSSKRGRPKKPTGIAAYWAAMSKEDRQIEMRRRLAERRKRAS